MSSSAPKRGVIGLVGLPNVGKSTLLNRLLGEDLAIVSPKPQTTWMLVRGILTDSRGQLVFIDTPGLHRPVDSLGGRMVGQARRGLSESDLVFWLADCRASPQEELTRAARYLTDPIPALLVITKIDLIARPQLLPLIQAYAAGGLFKEIVPVSALKGDNVDDLLHTAFALVGTGPPFFPPDQLSDQPERDLIREFIREKVFLNTNREIPYSSAVSVQYVKQEEGRLLISAVIFVERESQKGIMVGKGGAKIRSIGTAARRRIEALVGQPVYLDLRVKVRRKWRSDKRSLSEFGYRN